MDKTQLKILLSKLEPMPEHDPELEQYETPADIAADILNMAAVSGDLDADVVDLGCGHGVFAIGAAVLGATVRAYDIDEDAVNTARENTELVEDELGRELDVSFTAADVWDVEDDADTVVMNPPFGLQVPRSNLYFLENAYDIADTVYAILHQSEEKRGETRDFLREFAARRGKDTEILAAYRFPLPRTYGFHGKERKHIKVDLYKFFSPS